MTSSGKEPLAATLLPTTSGANLSRSGKEVDRGSEVDRGGANTFTAAQVLDHLWYELTNVPEFGTKY